MKRVSIVFLVAALAATSFISAAEINLGPGTAQKIVVFQLGIADQFVVLKDRAVSVLGDLQEKYHRGSKPEMHVVDYRDNSLTTKAYLSKKPLNDKYPYFYLVAKDGLILAQGELSETASDNVELIEKFQEKKPEPTPSVKVAINADVASSDTLIITKAGYFLLNQDAGGVPSLTKIEHVIKLDDPTNPPPPPPIDPALSERAKLFQKAANATGDPATAKKLAALFLGLADQVKTGAIKDRAKLEQVMSTALDLFLNDPATKAKWAGVRKLLSDQWTSAVQEGATMAQYGLLLTDVSAGLDASAGGQEAISVATIIKILTLILSKDTLDLKTILEILRLIGGEL